MRQVEIYLKKYGLCPTGRLHGYNPLNQWSEFEFIIHQRNNHWTALARSGLLQGLQQNKVKESALIIGHLNRKYCGTYNLSLNIALEEHVSCTLINMKDQ